MIYFGLISSIFDFATFGALLLIFKANESLFQTGWLWESFLTEVIIIFIIRTRRSFWRSRPSRVLILTSLATALAVLLFIYSPLAVYFQFTPLPVLVFVSLILITAVYFAVVEYGKRIFYKKFEI